MAYSIDFVYRSTIGFSVASELPQPRGLRKDQNGHFGSSWQLIFKYDKRCFFFYIFNNFLLFQINLSYVAAFSATFPLPTCPTAFPNLSFSACRSLHGCIELWEIQLPLPCTFACKFTVRCLKWLLAMLRVMIVWRLKSQGPCRSWSVVSPMSPRLSARPPWPLSKTPPLCNSLSIIISSSWRKLVAPVECGWSCIPVPVKCGRNSWSFLHPVLQILGTAHTWRNVVMIGNWVLCILQESSSRSWLLLPPRGPRC